MKRKVLVVGGAGYLGGAVTDRLLQIDNCNVRVFDLLLYEDHYLKPVDFTFGDVRNWDDSLQELIEWADSVIWLAAIVGDGACKQFPEATEDINLRALKPLKTFCKDKHVVFMSTCSVYGQNDDTLDETSEIKPLSLYAETKWKAEQFIRKNIDSATIFRLGTLFGVGDVFSRIRMDLVVNVMTMNAYRYQKIIVYGGEQYRPLLHVKDAARAVVDSAMNPIQGTYNLALSNVQIKNLACQIKNHFQDAQLIIADPPGSPDRRNYKVSTDRARSTLHFVPVYYVDHGIVEIANLLRDGRIVDLDCWRYSNEKFISKHPVFAEGAVNKE